MKAGGASTREHEAEADATGNGEDTFGEGNVDNERVAYKNVSQDGTYPLVLLSRVSNKRDGAASDRSREK